MNRYLIGNKECAVTFYSENVVNMKGLCTLHFEETEEEFPIPLELLEIIATPAP